MQHGSGLGLIIAKMLINKLGPKGSFNIASKLN